MANIEQIKQRLAQDFQLLTEKGFNVVGVFLQGSQNYGLDYEGSDIDTRAIIVPKMDDIILNRKPVSTMHIKDDNSHLEIKDIRLMFECFKKQNITFLEMLFTPYYLMNPTLEGLYQPIFDHAEEIAHYNNYAAVNCMVGMIGEEKAALCHRFEGLAQKIDTYGYDSKRLHHIIRVYEFLNRYLSGESFKDCLHSHQKEYLITIKKDNRYYSLEEAVKLAQDYYDKAKIIKDNYQKEHTLAINREVDCLMEQTLLAIFKASFIASFKDEFNK